MADCTHPPGHYTHTAAGVHPWCATHDRPMKSQRAAHGLPATCPGAGTPRRAPTAQRDERLDAFLPEG